MNSTPAQYPMLFGSQAKPLETIVYKIPELEGQNGYITISPDDCTPVMENLEGSIEGSKHRININPFMPKGISRPYQLDESISILRVVG